MNYEVTIINIEGKIKDYIIYEQEANDQEELELLIKKKILKKKYNSPGYKYTKTIQKKPQRSI